MPVVTIDMLEGRSHEQKKQLVAAITKAMVDIAHARPGTLHVIIHEVSRANWALAGDLMSEQVSGSAPTLERPQV